MGRRIVFDIEANGLADVWDHATEIHCVVAKDIDTQEIFTFGEHPECQFGLNYFPKLLKKCDVIIGHNIISYDLKVLRTLLGINFTIADTCDEDEAKENSWAHYDTVCGRECFIDDTLVLSKTLNPDRMGHSLEDFGQRLGFHKIDWRQEAIELGLIEHDSPSGAEFATYHPRMLEYCIRDVEVNELVHRSLYDEWGDWDWSKAYWLEKAVAELVSRSEDHGFFFDQELARENVEWLTAEMKRLEEKVEPLLPRRPLPASRQPNFPAKPFTDSGEISAHGWSWLQRLGYPVDEEVLKFKAPPKTAFKQDGSVSKAGERYCESNGVTEPEDMADYLRQCLKMAERSPLPEELMQKALKDLRDKRMPELTEPMQLSNQGDIKAYLVSMGWNPIAFKDKDLTVDAKKRKHDRVKFLEACERYIEETEGSPLEPFRLEHLKVNSVYEMRQKFLEHDLAKPLKVLTQPIYTDGNDKENLCPNLIKLGEKYDYVKDIVHWLTYRHRRNSILSPNGTGFLTHPRLKYDGRLPTPADTCGCASSRFQHKIVANIPRVTSLFGEPMRAMFCVPQDKVQIGCDADGLEARIEGHYCLPYNGEEYAKALIAPKPNDLHTVNSKKMGVDRDSAKTLKYSSSYGAQPPKIAKQMGWTLEKAKQVFNAFWEASAPLAELKKRLEQHWVENDKKWILGIDGRKLVTRSKHSLVNNLFQSAGVICMKRAAIYWDRWVRDENLDAKLIIMYHDESQMEDNIKNTYLKVFSSEEEAEAWKKAQEKRSGRIFSDIGHKDGKYWCGYNRAGELAALSISKGGKFYKIRVPLTGGYQLGRNWAQCH